QSPVSSLQSPVSSLQSPVSSLQSPVFNPMSQAFYLKFRPQTWSEVIGQEHIITSLHNAVAADRFAHAFLFAGPRGTGKTSVARILAKAVNCLHEDPTARPCNQCDHCQAVNRARFLDLIEIDAASNTSVDDVRDLRDKINFSPNQGRYKIYLIDEVHMLSTAAFNALLKTLEEPPPHALFILATTEIHKIPATVLSRCQRHEFRRIPVNDIVSHLKILAESENLQVESEALTLIARQATGSLRDAVSLLDQLASTSQEITLKVTQAVLGTAASQSVIEIVSAILAQDSARGLDRIHQTLDAGSDPRQFARQIVDYLRSLLLVRMGNADQVDATADVRSQMAQHAQAFPVHELLRVIRIFNHAANDARNAWQPALPLELAFIESLKTPPESDARPREADSPPTEAAAPKIKTGTSRVGAARQTSPPPETSPAHPVPESDPLPQNISQHWKQILSLARQRNPQTQALLNSCKPLGVKNGTLILGFNGEFAKSKMEQDDNIEIVSQVMEQVMGEAMPIRCVMAVGDALPDDIDQDGMVATALRDLGGEIVDIQ
ncbi:MAG: DNA polymerase III subunit gamma/tau, partial [Chloroflexi bacterium]|nr:DNA polymerase III subunit gamma/tau [Chloroflexota bacterium]